MIHQLIERFLKRRHFWRYASFSEVAELYASRTMRLFALRMVSTFTAIYLYLEGYSLVFIAFFWTAFYIAKVLFAWWSARLIVQYGPKHATLISNVVSAVSMVLLPFAVHPDYGIYALAGWCILQAFSGTLNDLGYLVDFSKVKDLLHTGKELGYMSILERLASGLSPVVGGMIAFLFGPETVMVVSAALFLLSAMPLLMTAEPIRTHGTLRFRRFPIKETWRSLVAESAIGFDVFATGIAWSLFMAVIVFSSGTDRVYAEVGLMASIALLIGFATSYAYGQIIDRKQGGKLLRYASIGNSAVHLMRVFITTPAGIVLTNAANEASTTGYSMSFTRGMFDTADRYHRRVEYLFFIEIVVNAGAALGGIMLGLLFMAFEGSLSLQIFFVVTAVITLLIATPRFALYKK